MKARGCKPRRARPLRSPSACPAPGPTQARPPRSWGATLLTCLLLLATAPALAQSGGAYDLTWHTVDAGGATIAGGRYLLGGTLGQPDAGLMTGEVYALGGGYWGGESAAAPGSRVYLPLATR